MTGDNTTGQTQADPMTFGEKAVGLKFNPSSDPDVQEIKKLYSEVIDKLNSIRRKEDRSEKARLLSVAITEAQGAQMWAVKGITWKD